MDFGSPWPSAVSKVFRSARFCKSKGGSSLTLKVACSSTASRFDRRENGHCTEISTNLQLSQILQNMLAYSVALDGDVAEGNFRSLG
jgi:hypothetical protein